MIVYFSRLDRDAMQLQSSVLSNFVIFSIIVIFVSLAARRRLPLYDVFVDWPNRLGRELPGLRAHLDRVEARTRAALRRDGAPFDPDTGFLCVQGGRGGGARSQKERCKDSKKGSFTCPILVWGYL